MEEKPTTTKECNPEQNEYEDEENKEMKEKGVTYEGVNGVKYDLKNVRLTKPSKWKKHKKIVKGIVTLLILASVLVIVVYGIMILPVIVELGTHFVESIPTEQEISRIESEMTEYLKERYEMEFIVEKPNLAGNAGFGRAWYADAHPKDNQSLTFGVAQDGNSYDDDYLNELWTSQGKPEVEALAKKIFGQGSDFRLNFDLYYYSDQSELNINELKKLKYSDLISSYGLNLYCDVEFIIYLEANEFDKKEQAEKIARFCNEYFDDNKIGTRFLFIHYINKNHKEEYNKMVKEGKIQGDTDALYKNKIMLNNLRINDNLVNITSEDVIIKFEY